VRRAVRGQRFPAIVPGAGASVDGLLLRALTAPQLAALDVYEGEVGVSVYVSVSWVCLSMSLSLSPLYWHTSSTWATLEWGTHSVCVGVCVPRLTRALCVGLWSGVCTGAGGG
jgi:hypothetical protein